MEEGGRPGSSGAARDAGAPRTGAVPSGKGGAVRDRRWRAGLLAPLLFTIGSALWLIGSACFVGACCEPGMGTGASAAHVVAR